MSLNNAEELNDAMNSGMNEKKMATFHGNLHFAFDAVLPFLQVFFRTHYQPDTENFAGEADMLDELANALVKFTNAVGESVSNSTHMNSLISCMTSVLSQSTLPVKVMEEFQEKFNRSGQVQDLKSDSRKKYDEDYEKEEEINVLLNIFANNFAVIYGGENSVKSQTGYPNEEMYFDPGGDEKLPLGQEFQDHLRIFVDEREKDPVKRYALAKKLVQQLE